MTQDEFVEQITDTAKANFEDFWGRLPDEQRLRPAGIEAIQRDIGHKVARALWQLAATYLEQHAEKEAGQCSCGRRCERHKTKKRINIDLLGLTVAILCVYYYCRACKKGRNPVRRWLGLEHGGVSLHLERATTDLSSRLTFGDTVDTLLEQHGQSMDRTKAERITYRVGGEAEVYLAQRRRAALSALEVEGRITGVEQLQLAADGGGVPVGTLKRPQRSEMTKDTPLTPIRKLPVGKRDIQAREARFITVRRPESKTERVIDCHIAPYNQTEVTGRRMLACAAEAGLRDNTNIHGVFDMGKWIHTQFETQLGHYPHTAIADIAHVTEYLTGAGRAIVGNEAARQYGQVAKRRLLNGELAGVLADLEQHSCHGQCPTDEQGCCLARAARRYISNNRRYMDYPPIRARDLPIGSGEAESGIRHDIKKRADVAGAWTEANVNKVLALITIRESGWWDAFWRWRDQRDIEAWHKRQRGELKPLFRGKRARCDVAIAQ